MGNIHDYTDSVVRLVSEFMAVCSVDKAITESDFDAIRQRLLNAIG